MSRSVSLPVTEGGGELQAINPGRSVGGQQSIAGGEVTTVGPIPANAAYVFSQCTAHVRISGKTGVEATPNDPPVDLSSGAVLKCDPGGYISFLPVDVDLEATGLWVGAVE